MAAEEFLEKINKIVEKARENKNSVEFSEIEKFCKDEKLTGDQMDVVYQYLEDNRIDIIQVMEPNDEEIVNQEKLGAIDPLLLEPTDEELEEEELDENMRLFESYARAGIEFLHEELVERPSLFDDSLTDHRLANIMALLNKEI